MTNESSNKLPIPPGALVAEVLRASGYALDLACGGVGVCGKCLVDVYSTSGTRRAVLACRTYERGRRVGRRRAFGALGA